PPHPRGPGARPHAARHRVRARRLGPRRAPLLHRPPPPRGPARPGLPAPGPRPVLIQQLRRLAAVPEVAANMAPARYEVRRVRHVIDLARDGRPLRVTDLAQDGPGGARGALRQVPAVVRTSDVAPTLLADGPDYLYGVPPGGDRPAKSGRPRRCRDA